MQLRDRRPLLLTICMAMASAMALVAQSVLARLNVPEAEARQYLVDSITSGYPSRSGAMTRAFLALPPAARAEVVTGALAWAKSVTATPAFTTAYLERREQNKPQPPEFDGTVEDELNRMREEQRKGLDDFKKMIPTLPADQRPAMEATLKQMTQQMDAQQKDPKFQAMMRQSFEMQRASQMEDYKRQVARWETQFPQDPKALIAAGLRKFLALPADVDFNAKLVKVAGTLKFENPEYEAKPSDWKLVYRAGREAMTAARASARAWLAELETSK